MGAVIHDLNDVIAFTVVFAGNDRLVQITVGRAALEEVPASECLRQRDILLTLELGFQCRDLVVDLLPQSGTCRSAAVVVRLPCRDVLNIIRRNKIVLLFSVRRVLVVRLLLDIDVQPDRTHRVFVQFPDGYRHAVIRVHLFRRPVISALRRLIRPQILQFRVAHL